MGDSSIESAPRFELGEFSTSSIPVALFCSTYVEDAGNQPLLGWNAKAFILLSQGAPTPHSGAPTFAVFFFGGRTRERLKISLNKNENMASYISYFAKVKLALYSFPLEDKKINLATISQSVSL